MQEMWVRYLGQNDPLGRKQQPIPGFLPRKPYGQRNLTGYSVWGHRELDRTERLSMQPPKGKGRACRDSRP